MSFQPLPPVSRLEPALRAVEPVQPRRLLTPDERDEARRQREQAREKRKRRESEGQVAPGHTDYLG